MSVKNNLPPESQPWARNIESQTNANTKAIQRIAQDNDNAFKAINSSMKQISRQIEALATVTDGLVQVTDALSVQQQELAALVNNQISASVVSNSATGFGLPSASTDYTIISQSVAVPAGYTRAIVYASVFINLRFPLATGGLLGGRVYLSASSTGGWSLGARATSSTETYEGSVYGVRSRLFQNLNGGTITVEGRAYAQPGASSVPPSSNSYAALDGQILFLR